MIFFSFQKPVRRRPQKVWSFTICKPLHVITITTNAQLDCNILLFLTETSQNRSKNNQVHTAATNTRKTCQIHQGRASL